MTDKDHKMDYVKKVALNVAIDYGGMSYSINQYVVHGNF